MISKFVDAIAILGKVFYKLSKHCCLVGFMCLYPCFILCLHPVSVHILANNSLRAHHASVHGGLSANGLSGISLSFFEMNLLSCLK